jgi:lysophospholipid acyltransferase (LPLAT)-like uncharacterized protein
MKMRRASSRSSFRKNGRGVSPAISTVMLTSAIVMLLLVTIGFANKGRAFGLDDLRFRGKVAAFWHSRLFSGIS